MIIDTIKTNNQINKIDGYIRNLNDTKNKLSNLRGNINSRWSAEEIRYLNVALDNVNLEISSATRLMATLKKDLSRALEQIKQEQQNKK